MENILYFNFRNFHDSCNVRKKLKIKNYFDRGFPYTSGIIPKSLFENLRTFLFVGMIFSGFGPLIHLHILDGGYITFGRTKFILFGCINMGFFYGIGMFFWITKIPERFFPGKFDIFGQSHSIWHIFIVLGATGWYYCMLQSFFLKINS